MGVTRRFFLKAAAVIPVGLAAAAGVIGAEVPVPPVVLSVPIPPERIAGTFSPEYECWLIRQAGFDEAVYEEFNYGGAHGFMGRKGDRRAAVRQLGRVIPVGAQGEFAAALGQILTEMG